MRRRGFLASLAAVVVAPFVPAVPPTVPPTPLVGLALHPNAFAIAMRPLTLRQPAPGGFARYVAASAVAEGRAS